MQNDRDMTVALRNHGGAMNLPDAPDGKILSTFEPFGLADVIELEINRAHIMGWTKISLHMDIPDAAALAAALRRQ